jgi:hypothetical protein
MKNVVDVGAPGERGLVRASKRATTCLSGASPAPGPQLAPPRSCGTKHAWVRAMNRSGEAKVTSRRPSGHRGESKTGGLGGVRLRTFCFVVHDLAAESNMEGPQQPRYAWRDRPTVQPSAQMFCRELSKLAERPDIGLLRQCKLGVF